MIQVIEAIYSGGVLKPVEKLALSETQRVRLIVQPLNQEGENSRSAALQRLLVGIESMQFFSSGSIPLEKNYMIALDTNFLIYACDRVDQGRQNQAIELISTAPDVVLLWQVACEFVAASRKLSTQGFTLGSCLGAPIGVLGAFPFDLANRCGTAARKVASYKQSLLVLGCNDYCRLFGLRRDPIVFRRPSGACLLRRPFDCDPFV